MSLVSLSHKYNIKVHRKGLNFHHAETGYIPENVFDEDAKIMTKKLEDMWQK
jgi:hypothetical protein